MKSISDAGAKRGPKTVRYLELAICLSRSPEKLAELLVEVERVGHISKARAVDRRR